MAQELSSGRWRSGRTFLAIIDDDVTPVDGQETGSFAYRIKSEYDEGDERRDPPAVDFTPSELRRLIQKTREALSEDPFEEGDFDPFEDWFNRENDRVIAEIGSRKGERKQFRVKEHEESGTRYLKVQRRWFDDNGDERWLRPSPTLGPDEFKGVFGEIAIL